MGKGVDNDDVRHELHVVVDHRLDGFLVRQINALVGKVKPSTQFPNGNAACLTELGHPLLAIQIRPLARHIEGSGTPIHYCVEHHFSNDIGLVTTPFARDQHDRTIRHLYQKSVFSIVVPIFRGGQVFILVKIHPGPFSRGWIGLGLGL